jgi:hypothetical protein
VLTPGPPGLPADISVRTILKLFFLLCCISSDLVFFSGSKGFWPWCITLGVTGGLHPSSGILNTRKNNVFQARGRWIYK